MGREPWYESDNPGRVARGLGWRAAVYVAAAVAVIGVIIVGIWAVRVATAPVRGAGDQQIIINDGRNRINAQQWFEAQYGLILAADRNLDEAWRNHQADPADNFWRTNYTGLKNRCIDMVAAYDAESRKVSREQWRSPDLPYSINQSDPATDCEPTEVPS